MRDAFERTVDRVAEHGREMLTHLLRNGGTIGDLYAEEREVGSMTLRIRRGRPTFQLRERRAVGAGFRVFDSAASAFAFTEDVSAEGLRASAEVAAGAFRSSTHSPPPSLGELRTWVDLPPDTLHCVSEEEIRALLHGAADAAQSLVPDLEATTVTLNGSSNRFTVASSDGRFERSARATISLRVHLRGRDGCEAHAIGGGRGGLGIFFARRPEDVASEAAEHFQATQQALYGAAVSGVHPVVLGSGWGGVWLHEVLGHALESDVTTYGFSGIGERVAGEEITVVDDPWLRDGRGGAPVDDEGTPAERTVLIDRGVLSGFLTDRASALRHDLPETGNGRRQDYRHEPLPRMSNLTLAPGSASPDDLIREAGNGLYVRMIGSGRVHPAEDRFAFDVLCANVIEGGRLGRPVTGIRIEGRPSDMLRRVVGIANDFRLDPGRGSCKKNGQVVPVSVGMPTILLDRLTISPSA